MNIIAIVQARTSSKRLKSKVLKKVQNNTIIEIINKRLNLSKKINKTIIAIPSTKNENKFYNFLIKKKMIVFRGSENNVLNRFYKAAIKYKANIIVRVTGDCPFVDVELIDKSINTLIKSKNDYVTNTNPPTYPDGLDIEVFTFECLKKTKKLAKSKYDLEHVTPFIKTSGLFKTKNIQNKIDLSHLRLTLDEKQDLKLVKKIFKHFHPNIYFQMDDITYYIKKNPKLIEINNMIKRNSGSLDNVGQKLWRKAKTLIPGGNSFFSKRPDIFLPDSSPVYYLKAKGCYVWTLENKKLIDMYLMGVGTNILGYSNSKINSAIYKAIKKSNVSSLNCPEEVELAEELLKLHPWADMAKFGRSGGETNSIAIRIARSFSKSDNIAFCGYHGWHDWYLSSNLSNKKNLDHQLFPNLKIEGVPKKLKNTAFPFKFNNFKSLERIVKKNKIGIIKMEVFRNIPPKKTFLKKIRKLADKKKIILIFDECTSGFRSNFGGIHKLYGVNPDIAIFGKALGNGHPITAIIGKKEIMEKANNSFISSTFWSERLGIVAALTTLKLMKKLNSWKQISKKGNYIEKKWKEIGKKYKLKIKCYGLPSIKYFEIISKDWIKYKTFISQEMLKKGFLASNAVYVSISHTDKIIRNYLNSIESIFKIIANCEKNNSIDTMLETKISDVGMKRQN